MDDSMLNAEQQVAVAYDRGRAVLAAIAGSGKTRVVVHRIARLVENGVDPSRILAVTFTRAAAAEMNERLTGLLGKTEARVGTIHSLALEIIRTETPSLRDWHIDADGSVMRGYAQHYLYDPKEGRARSGGGEITPQDVVGLIGFVQNHGLDLDTEDPEPEPIIALIQRAWSPEVWKSPRLCCLMLDAMRHTATRAEVDCVLTFDGMLERTRRLLENEETRAKWAACWDYVLQDEAQDQSPVQAMIMESLASSHGNYMQVGDISQSIYQFRGAQPSLLADVRRRADVLHLSTNYRCGRCIVAAANSILSEIDPECPPMVSAVDFNGGVRTAINYKCNETGEVLDCIGDPRKASIAILARVSATLAAHERALVNKGIPCVNLNAIDLYSTLEVGGPVAYLRIASSNAAPSFDDLWLAMRAPLRYISKKTAQLCHAALTRRVGKPLADIVREEGRPGYEVAKIERWAAVMRAVTAAVKAGGSPSDALRPVLQDPEFQPWVVELNDQEKSTTVNHAENVRALTVAAHDCSTVPEFLAMVDKERAEHKRRKSRDKAATAGKVVLSTIHGVKGLEYDQVFIVGCNEGTLPHVKGEAEEEERLFYVATTRAKRDLTYVCSEGRCMIGGMMVTIEPSSFLYRFGMIGE
jgi:DNA helicase-2/ATP-dependent DNA helicase PcrA